MHRELDQDQLLLKLPPTETGPALGVPPPSQLSRTLAILIGTGSPFGLYSYRYIINQYFCHTSNTSGHPFILLVFRL